MVVDTSAIIAILFAEPPSTRLEDAILDAAHPVVSVASRVEAGMVALGRLGEQGDRELDLLLLRLRVEVATATPEHAELCLDAFRRYGKGRHPAKLNFGDCFSYALARALSEPLLFVGDDFSRTDVDVAPY